MLSGTLSTLLTNNKRMYFSPKDYPEFKKQNKKYIHEALKYCIIKEKISRRFWTAVASFVSLHLIWALYIEPIYFNESNTRNTIFFNIVVGLLFYLYLIYEINISVRKAVQKHIKTFDG